MSVVRGSNPLHIVVRKSMGYQENIDKESF